jgi:hypothetical protein
MNESVNIVKPPPSVISIMRSSLCRFNISENDESINGRNSLGGVYLPAFRCNFDLREAEFQGLIFVFRELVPVCAIIVYSTASAT